MAEMERIVLQIPVEFTAEMLAEYCKVSVDSAVYEVIEETLPLINAYAAPKAILRRAVVEAVEGDDTTINGVTFHSRIVAEKLRGQKNVFLSVITEGNGLDRCEDLEGDPFLDTFKTAVLRYATKYVIRYMKEQFDFDGAASLNPGSLPDWPIRNNFALLEMIGDPEEIGVTQTPQGYMDPWNSGSHIHFEGGDYENCSLCRNYSCIGRRAPFNRQEYIRIYGQEP